MRIFFSIIGVLLIAGAILFGVMAHYALSAPRKHYAPGYEPGRHYTPGWEDYPWSRYHKPKGPMPTPRKCPWYRYHTGTCIYPQY